MSITYEVHGIIAVREEADWYLIEQAGIPELDGFFAKGKKTDSSFEYKYDESDDYDAVPTVIKEKFPWVCLFEWKHMCNSYFLDELGDVHFFFWSNSGEAVIHTANIFDDSVIKGFDFLKAYQKMRQLPNGSLGWFAPVAPNYYECYMYALSVPRDQQVVLYSAFVNEREPIKGREEAVREDAAAMIPLFNGDVNVYFLSDPHEQQANETLNSAFASYGMKPIEEKSSEELALALATELSPLRDGLTEMRKVVRQYESGGEEAVHVELYPESQWNYEDEDGEIQCNDRYAAIPIAEPTDYPVSVSSILSDGSLKPGTVLRLGDDPQRAEKRDPKSMYRYDLEAMVFLGDMQIGNIKDDNLCDLIVREEVEENALSMSVHELTAGKTTLTLRVFPKPWLIAPEQREEIAQQMKPIFDNAQKTAPTIAMKPVVVELVGTHAEGRGKRIANMHAGDAVRVVRELDNPYSKNAINIFSSEGSLGHVSEEDCRILAPLFDKGKIDETAYVVEALPASMKPRGKQKAFISVRIVPKESSSSEKPKESAPTNNPQEKTAKRTAAIKQRAIGESASNSVAENKQREKPYLDSSTLKKAVGTLIGDTLTFQPDTQITAQNKDIRCDKVRKIVLPNGLLIIGSSSFLDYNHLKHVDVPDTIERIDWGAFYGCKSLESVNLPSGMRKIGPSVFKDDGCLKRIDIPQTVTAIEENAFSGCVSLKELRIPPFLKAIPTGMCDNEHWLEKGEPELERIIFTGNALKKIGKKAFVGCFGLTALELPQGLAVIESEAFRYCASLQAVLLPETMSSIGERAFANNPALRFVQIPASVDKIGAHTFQKCPDLVLLVEEGSYAQTYAQEKSIRYEVRQYASMDALFSGMDYEIKPPAYTCRASVIAEKEASDARFKALIKAPTPVTPPEQKASPAVSNDMTETAAHGIHRSTSDNTRVTLMGDFSIAIPKGSLFSTDKKEIGNNRFLVFIKTEATDYYRQIHGDAYGNSYNLISPFDAPQCFTIQEVTALRELSEPVNSWFTSADWFDYQTHQQLCEFVKRSCLTLPFCSGEWTQAVTVVDEDELIACYGRNGKESTMYFILTPGYYYVGQLWVNDEESIEACYEIMESWLRTLRKESALSATPVDFAVAKPILPPHEEDIYESSDVPERSAIDPETTPVPRRRRRQAMQAEQNSETLMVDTNVTSTAQSRISTKPYESSEDKEARLNKLILEYNKLVSYVAERKYALFGERARERREAERRMKLLDEEIESLKNQR